MSKNQTPPHVGAIYRLEKPVVSWRDSVLRNEDFDDLYFDAHDGLAESQYVFLKGTKLREKLFGSSHLTIAETGFGTGLNFLAVTGRDAFQVLAALAKQGCRIDAYWADDARINECEDQQKEADEIQNIRQKTGWNGLYFGGTAFKKQRDVKPADYAKSALIAGGFMDVVTTSGIATGSAAEISKITTFRSALPNKPIALASGITPENAADYAMVDCFMVATGINIADDFYNIDPAKLGLLISECHKMRDTQ